MRDVTRLHSTYRSALRDECVELVETCYALISLDGSIVPSHQRDWKIGHTFSWHYVKTVEFRVEQLTRSIEDIIVATKGKKAKVQYDASSYVFVKCELDSEDKAAAKIWIEENTKDLGPTLHDVIASDYKFTCSFSPEHDTFTACLVGKEDNPINGKKTLTARHKEWVYATMTVLYKHLQIFGGGVWETDNDNTDDGWA